MAPWVDKARQMSSLESMFGEALEVINLYEHYEVWEEIRARNEADVIAEIVDQLEPDVLEINGDSYPVIERVLLLRTAVFGEESRPVILLPYYASTYKKSKFFGTGVLRKKFLFYKVVKNIILETAD